MCNGTKGSKNMKIIKLNQKTKNLIARLLNLQQKAKDNDQNKTLNQINQILFTINEKWRNKMLQVNEIDYLDKGYKSIINATCYKF
jgi:hypothetical protein